MKPKLSDNQKEALYTAINEAFLKYERCMEPVDAELMMPKLARDPQVQACLRAFEALERAMNRLDRRVARILGERAKTMGTTFEEAYPELFQKRRSA